MKGYVLFNTKPGTSQEVTRSLKESGLAKNIISADPVYGRFDAILVIEAKDLEEFGEILYQVIERNPNILHTETCVSLPSGD